MIRDVDLQKYETHIIYWDDENLMFPRNDLYPSDDIFPVGVDELGNIVSGTMKLDEVIVDSEIRFGELFASKFEVQVFNVDDITNKFIQVYQLQDGDYHGIFSGKIVSCKQDNTGLDRTIVAYDMAYVLRDKDVSDWWLHFWGAREPEPVYDEDGKEIPQGKGVATIKEVRNSLLDYMNISSVDKTLPNDNIPVHKNISATFLSFGTVLSMLCELGGCFPHFNRDNELEFITLSPYNSVNLNGLYEGLNSTFEDYTTDYITGVEFYDSEGELKYMVGDLTNVYKLSSNIFCYDMSTDEIQATGNNLLNAIRNISYTPATVKMIVGDLSYSLGTYVRTPKGSFYIFENQFSNAQLVEQTMIAKGEKTLGESSRKLTDEMLILNEKYSRLTFNVEQFLVEFGDYQEEVASQFKQTAESISTEVSKGLVGVHPTYQGDYVPTFYNYPANEWTTEDDQAKNVGATFYNSAEGRTYRWTNLPNAVAVTFDEQCEYSVSYGGGVYLFCDVDNTMRTTGQMYVPGKTVYVPNSTFYLYFAARMPYDSYGFKVVNIYGIYSEDPNRYVNRIGSVPSGDNIIIDILHGTSRYPESNGHNPYEYGDYLWQINTGIQLASDNHRYGWVPQEGYAYSKLNQTAEMISTEVTERKFAEDGMKKDYTSKIEQTSKSIRFTVSEKGDALPDPVTGKTSFSSIISMEKDKIEIGTGRLIINSENFKLTADGTVTTENANIHGEIHCGTDNSGRIDIYDNIIKGNRDTYIDFEGTVDSSTGMHLNGRQIVLSTSALGITKSRNNTEVFYGYTGKKKFLTDVDVWQTVQFVNGILVK